MKLFSIYRRKHFNYSEEYVEYLRLSKIAFTKLHTYRENKRDFRLLHISQEKRNMLTFCCNNLRYQNVVDTNEKKKKLPLKTSIDLTSCSLARSLSPFTLNFLFDSLINNWKWEIFVFLFFANNNFVACKLHRNAKYLIRMRKMHFIWNALYTYIRFRFL